MRIVLDTTVLNADPLQQSIAWKAVASASHALRVTVYVPEVVIMEAVAHYGRVASLFEEGLSGLMQKRGVHLNLPSVSAVHTEIADIVQAYEAGLRARLTSARVQILPIPDVSHKVLIDRATSRRKPSDSHGNGYRDALNWLAVIELAKTGSEPLVWVSANYTDFGFADTSDLHPDLVAELDGLGLSGVVSMRKSISDIDLPRPIEPKTEFETMPDDDLRELLSTEIRTSILSPAFLTQQSVPGIDLRIDSRHGIVEIAAVISLREPTIEIRSTEATFATATFAVRGQFDIQYLHDEMVQVDDAPPEFRTTTRRTKRDLVLHGQAGLKPGQYAQIELSSISLPTASFDDFDKSQVDALRSFQEVAELLKGTDTELEDVRRSLLPALEIIASVANVSALYDARAVAGMAAAIADFARLAPAINGWTQPVGLFPQDTIASLVGSADLTGLHPTTHEKPNGQLEPDNPDRRNMAATSRVEEAAEQPDETHDPDVGDTNQQPGPDRIED